LPAVVNIGRRPTFHPEAGEDLVEVHLLEGGRDLYGQTLEVLFRAKLREEQRFSGPDALKAQIEADVAAARRLLATRSETIRLA
ncbi:MAG: riboflavin kinase, partial [Gemmatimonadetes bacterium]|nr:riboflavin kinase [Gemmatimonadota bacterium]